MYRTKRWCPECGENTEQEWHEKGEKKDSYWECTQCGSLWYESLVFKRQDKG
jgi:uncharacterized Zn finger protein